jgi:predicted nucleotidyltransferase
VVRRSGGLERIEGRLVCEAGARRGPSHIAELIRADRGSLREAAPDGYTRAMETVDSQRWAALRRRFDVEAATRKALAGERRAAAETLAQVLIERFHARRAILFGSLARGETTGKLDIDLAVEGLDKDLELRAWAELSELTDAPIDLVRCEDASPRLATAIAREGLVLCERA